jgi:outer membrane protein
MKKLIVLLFVLLPLGLFAQELKIAHVNFQEVLIAVPEFSTVEKDLNKLNEDYKKELETMNNEYTKMYSDYIAQQDSLTENIKLRRQQDLQDKSERLSNFYEFVKDDLSKKQQQFIQPIQEKVLKAIKEVGDEKGYAYILTAEPSLLFYISPSAIDATPLVKAKLGIK